MARRADVLEERLEERAVLEDLHRVAADRHPEADAGEGGDERVERLVGLELEVRVLVALDGPDRHAEEHDGGEQDEDEPMHRPTVTTGRLHR
jgi:hypothetical protein